MAEGGDAAHAGDDDAALGRRSRRHRGAAHAARAARATDQHRAGIHRLALQRVARPPRERWAKKRGATRRVACPTAAAAHAPACCWRRCRRRRARSAWRAGSKPPLRARRLERAAWSAVCGEGARASLARHFRSAGFSPLLACWGCCAQYSCARAAGAARASAHRVRLSTYRPDRRAAAPLGSRGGGRGRPVAAARLQRAGEDVEAAGAAEPGEPTGPSQQVERNMRRSGGPRARAAAAGARAGSLRSRGAHEAGAEQRASHGEPECSPKPEKARAGRRARTALRSPAARS